MTMSIDPITLEVLTQGLISVVREMRATVMRTAKSVCDLRGQGLFLRSVCTGLASRCPVGGYRQPRRTDALDRPVGDGQAQQRPVPGRRHPRQ